MTLFCHCIPAERSIQKRKTTQNEWFFFFEGSDGNNVKIIVKFEYSIKSMPQQTHNLRIHGDNILECESALKLIASALNGGHFELFGGSAYAPTYTFKSNTNEVFIVQLFPGYGRWSFPLTDYVASLGGTLREAPDAIITRLENLDGAKSERPILAFEFSGALPAGNNAWQRTGRALALAYAGIPYLYFAELGGQELDSERVIKAARFPNPLVPFAYAVLGMSSNSISLPIYVPSPSSHKDIVEIYKDCFGDKESVSLVRGLLLSEDVKETRDQIEKKVAKILEILSGQRKRASSILKPEEWAEFYSQKSGLAKAQWLVKKAMPWSKKTGIKSLTPTFSELLIAAKTANAVAIGSKEMPLCLISEDNRSIFATEIKKIYKGKISDDFQKWISTTDRPLVCVWVAGFKPRGDDSRPDRGLVPMARMIFGLEDVDLVTIVYGPAKPSTWTLLKNDMWKLAANNGLWEAIINLSNGIIIDSNTATTLDSYGFLVNKEKKAFEKKLLPAASEVPSFGEHDVDSVLHLLFSNAVDYGVYESLCNPPGGDWSGINVFDFDSGHEFRWTSLPRVSGLKSKRPDHLAQIKDIGFLSVESKDTEPKLEDDIGPRLIDYVKSLFLKAPTSFREKGVLSWSQYTGRKLADSNFISGAAFRFLKIEELASSLKRGKVDIVFGVEFKKDAKHTTIHIFASKKAEPILPLIKKLAQRLNGLITLEIH